MRQRKSYRYNFILVILMLLFFVGNIFVAAGQTSIGGVINRYAKVVSISSNSVEIQTLDQASRFAVGDTILLIQMKGVVMNTYGNDYGGIQGRPDGAIGLHEFLIISSISGRQINFASPIVHYGNTQQTDNFNVNADVQIIRTPSYPSAIVTSKVEATPWDSINGYGGVVAFFAGKSLELNADIDVSGQGFAGAEAVEAVGTPIGDDDLVQYSYTFDSDISGLKGEGVGYRLAITNTTTELIYPNYSKGKAPNYSGGGGGSGAFSGGGGGSNGGAGGTGGKEKTPADGYRAYGGLGGKDIPLAFSNQSSPLPSSNVRLFLGGGGGGSVHNNGDLGLKAGNGGGIIIIVCDSIIGNGHRILSNGETPSGSAPRNAGAGGGGAGGSIAIYTSAFADSNITISANGGNGGDGGDLDPITQQPNIYGDGGGGGGGIIALNKSLDSFSDSVSVSVNPGVGLFVNSGDNGSEGDLPNDFLPLLNGFLFNSIWSSGTGSRIDSVCQGSYAPTIVGTTPTGVGPFTYLWQTTTDVLSRDYTSVNGGRNFSPGQLSDTTWIRRVVTDTRANPTVSDTSNWVMLIYHPAITNNEIFHDSTICENQSASFYQIDQSLQGGNGIYSYQWQQQTNGSWSNINASNPDMTTGSLIQTTRYSRVVTSGSCVSRSNTVTANVLPKITGNMAVANQQTDYCGGVEMDPIVMTNVVGGNGTYSYQWQQSSDTITWIVASGNNNSSSYTPSFGPSTASSKEMYYRRHVYSGPNNVCSNVSKPIHITQVPAISNNTISLSDICYDGTSAEFTVSSPVGGSGSYTYAWQSSSNGQQWNDVGTNSNYTIRGPLTNTTMFRRIVHSSICTDISDIISVYNIPLASAGNDDSVCGNEYNLRANEAAGHWIFPHGVIGNNSSYNTSVSIPITSYNDDGFISHSFVWEIDGGVCVGRDTVEISFYREVDSEKVFAGKDTVIGPLDRIFQLNASIPEPYEIGTWSVVSGTGSFTDEHSYNTYVTNLSDNNTFQWTVTNGACSESKTIDILVFSIDVPEGLSPNGDGINDILDISGIDFLNQDAELTILNGAGKKIYSTSNINGKTWADWDGRNDAGQEMPEGTYYYILKVSSRMSNAKVTRSGFIVLKRK